MKKVLLLAGLLSSAFSMNAQCDEPLATLNVDFTAFGDDFPQNCWTAIADGPMVYIDGEDDARAATFYSFGSPNVAGYIVTPQLSTTDGNHTLSFEAVKAGAGAVTIQIGTMSNPEDIDTFEEAGDIITLTEENSTYTNAAIPASDTQKYIAFRIVSDAPHHAAMIDNVVWTTSLGLGNAVTIDANFSLYPNPSADKQVTLNYELQGAGSDKGSVTIYTLTGAKVYQSSVTNTSASLNLSSLNSGIYIVNFEAGNYSVSKKLILN